MGLINYVAHVRDSTLGGMPVTGLKPTWVFLKSLVTGLDITPLPAITEIGYGQYTFQIDPAEGTDQPASPTTPVVGDCSGQIDFGQTLRSSYDRFKDVICLVADEHTAYNLDARVSSRQAAPVTPTPTT